MKGVALNGCPAQRSDPLHGHHRQVQRRAQLLQAHEVEVLQRLLDPGVAQALHLPADPDRLVTGVVLDRVVDEDEVISHRLPQRPEQLGVAGDAAVGVVLAALEALLARLHRIGDVVVDGPAADVPVGRDRVARAAEQAVQRQAGMAAGKVPEHLVHGLDQAAAGVHEPLRVPEALPDALAVEGVHAGQQVGDLHLELPRLPCQLARAESAGVGGVRVQVAVGDQAQDQVVGRRLLTVFRGFRRRSRSPRRG